MRLQPIIIGQTITDLCLNGCGNLSNWEDICELNSFDDWTPTLTTQNYIVSDVISQPVFQYQLQFTPANNTVLTSDITGQISDLINIFETATQYKFYISDETINSNLYYTVLQGNTISDVCLNGAGTILAWESILETNNYEDWTPNLSNNLQLLINYDTPQTNVLQSINACNNTDAIDLDLQISELVSIFVELNSPIYDFENGIEFLFENKIEYIFNK